MMIQTKKAVRRKPGYPTGEPAPCFIPCCENEIDVPEFGKTEVFTFTVHCPTCGTVYNQAGWIMPAQECDCPGHQGP
jgi:hypothetical protein